MRIDVNDIMGRFAIAVSKEATFGEIIRAMGRFGVGAVTVIDADQRPVGVVSETDLLVKAAQPAGAPLFEASDEWQRGDKAAGVTAAQLMTTPAITVTPGTSVREAARLMHAKQIKQLPVVDPASGRIIGTLHQRDVLRVFLRPAAELEADIKAVLPQRHALTLDIDQGVVTVGGSVEWRSQAVALEERIWLIDGVVDVRSEVVYDKDDLAVVPSGW
ncbi:BON domain-containing protein [Nonomuraea maritima]|uniref:BON domain-containing protein n=1 Tax=Nonomuraea maritima TaxID=683260 RepID=A0A1G9BM38_9ACTN|nr:CBS domain-containing protein [Nonomuraea maritima]SDK40537.1 BON domain-containing protein [Nonomuraea maritima]